MSRPHPDRLDVPNVGLFNRYEDAQGQARFRADLTGRRYRVRFERNNRWWQITETTERLHQNTRPQALGETE